MLNSIFPKIHNEGYKFLAISIIITFFCLLISKTLGLFLILITIWVYYFFRDPDRFSINDDNFLVSPADGLISNIAEVAGPIELGLENKSYTYLKARNGSRICGSQFSLFCGCRPNFSVALTPFKGALYTPLKGCIGNFVLEIRSPACQEILVIGNW